METAAATARLQFGRGAEHRQRRGPDSCSHVPLYGQLGAKGVVGTTPLVFTTVAWALFLGLVTCENRQSPARKPALCPHDSHNGLY